MSFDVSSLFTNVPIDEAVLFIHEKLLNNETLMDRTNLTPDQISELLQICLHCTYFSYEGVIYEQKEGAEMGSSVSAVVVNLFLRT